MIDNCSKPQASSSSSFKSQGKVNSRLLSNSSVAVYPGPPPPPGVTPHHGLYGEAPPEKGTFLGFKLLYERVRISLVEVDEKGKEIYLFGLFKSSKWLQGSYKKLQPFLKDFSRTTNQEHNFPIVQKCSFPVHFSTFFSTLVFSQ